MGEMYGLLVFCVRFVEKFVRIRGEVYDVLGEGLLSKLALRLEGAKSAVPRRTTSGPTRWPASRPLIWTRPYLCVYAYPDLGGAKRISMEDWR